MIQRERVHVLTPAEVRDGRYVLYWMQQSQRARVNHALEYAVRRAEELKLPVVAVFGPTVRAWGYFPLDPRSRVVEKDVACRPCSKAGERPCRQPETWCLTRSTVDEVTSVVEDAWSANASDRRFR